MSIPAPYNLTIYRGDSFDLTVGVTQPGGRVLEHLTITSGSPVATAPDGAFTAADIGKKIATADGTGIADGTTITSVSSATTIGLSANASVSGTVSASIRALDASAYTDHLIQIRPDSESTDVDATLTVTETRKAVGVFILSLTATDTAALTRAGVWDWQVLDGTKTRTLLAGTVTLVDDVSRGA